MNEPDQPSEVTLPQSPADVGRILRPNTHFQVGQPIPNREMWVLERELGVGGFGAVWLAKHEWKDERVAVKFCTHPAARHQLVTHEKKVIARVMRHGGNHPNVVPLLDCNLSGDTPWLIYEYVSGGTLAEAVFAWKELPLAARLELALPVLHALADALGTFHRLEPPVVHRDMKPYNVLMADGRTPRITDFGLGGAVVPSAESDSAHTGRSVLLPDMLRAMGTTRYAPPEQMRGEPPSPRDDVYALGIIAYQMAAADLKAVPGTDTNDELLDLGVPADLVRLIVRSVATNPERRPKDATEWSQKLTGLLPQQAPAAPPIPAGVSLDLGGGIDPTDAPPTPTPSRVPTELELRQRAEDAFETGETYYHGRGVPQDYARAREYFEKAAALDHPGALHCLGVIHHFGYGVPADFAAARRWYEQAAARGSAAAQNNLAVMCEAGRGAPQDFAAARAWYEKAAAQGLAAAQNKLGVLFELGRGGPQDFAHARAWYTRAAAQSHAGAMYNLGAMSEKGRGVEQDYAKARTWYQQAAALGHARAQHSLGLMYDYGRGVPQSYAKARAWYEKAAAQGDAAAQSDLGVLYELGRGVPQDYAKAREWYEKAVAQGHARAKTYLAELYEKGRGVNEDAGRARELYTAAAAQGDAQARRGLARLDGDDRD